MKTKTNCPNEAVRILRQRHIGPSALAHATGASKSTTAGWLEGLKPGDDYRAVVASTLGVSADAWDRAPTKKTKNSPSKPSQAAPIILAPDSAEIVDKSGLEFGTLDTVFAELARLRGHRRQAEAEDRLPAVLALAATELRVLRRLAISNGETSLRGQLRAHPFVRQLVGGLLGLEDPDTRARLRIVIAEHRLVPAAAAPNDNDDDPVLKPAPDAAARGLACLLRRTARSRARAETVADPTISGKWLAFEARARDVAGRVAGHEPTLVASPEWGALRLRLLDCFQSADVLRPLLDSLAGGAP